MTDENRNTLLSLLKKHRELGISDQIDYDKFYLYSLIAHSTAIEGSTVTEVEALLLFDEGITSSKRSILEQNMNLDLKQAYDYGAVWIMRHEAITVDWLISLAAKVMARTGGQYNAMGGSFDASKGELRKLNVTAGVGGSSYVSWTKVPSRLKSFCAELNRLRQSIDASDHVAIYDMSFWAHYELVTIHPWADGNGRTSRLLMNLLQMEHGLLLVKVLKQDKAEYIQSLVDAREYEDIEIFVNCMAKLHCRQMRQDIDRYVRSIGMIMVDKTQIIREMADKWSINPSLVDKMADIIVFVADKDEVSTDMVVQKFGMSPSTAKRYLRQLAEFGYLVAQGANRNRTYKCNL